MCTKDIYKLNYILYQNAYSLLWQALEGRPCGKSLMIWRKKEFQNRLIKNQTVFDPMTMRVKIWNYRIRACKPVCVHSDTYTLFFLTVKQNDVSSELNQTKHDIPSIYCLCPTRVYDRDSRYSVRRFLGRSKRHLLRGHKK